MFLIEKLWKLHRTCGLSRPYLAYIVNRVTTLLKHMIKLVCCNLVPWYFSLSEFVPNKLLNDGLGSLMNSSSFEFVRNELPNKRVGSPCKVTHPNLNLNRPPFSTKFLGPLSSVIPINLARHQHHPLFSPWNQTTIGLHHESTIISFSFVQIYFFNPRTFQFSLFKCGTLHVKF
jgi:hypothetical protein